MEVSTGLVTRGGVGDGGGSCGGGGGGRTASLPYPKTVWAVGDAALSLSEGSGNWEDSYDTAAKQP